MKIPVGSRPRYNDLGPSNPPAPPGPVFPRTPGVVPRYRGRAWARWRHRSPSPRSSGGPAAPRSPRLSMAGAQPALAPGGALPALPPRWCLWEAALCAAAVPSRWAGLAEPWRPCGACGSRSRRRRRQRRSPVVRSLSLWKWKRASWRPSL